MKRYSILLLLLIGVEILWPRAVASASCVGCGTYDTSDGTPKCIINAGQCELRGADIQLCSNGVRCCSWDAQCWPPTRPPLPTSDPAFNPYTAPRKEFFDMVDPLHVGGGQTIQDEQESAYVDTLRSPGGIVSRLLVFIFPLAGLILFLMLVWGGFEMLIGAPTKKSMESGRNRVTAAIVGFLLLFSSYWIWQIIEVVFGVKIL